MQISQAQFNELNVIALTLVRKIDTKTYDEMCDILSDIYKTDIAESEECAKDVIVESFYGKSLAEHFLDTCNQPCTIRGMHKHTKVF